jgi:ferredoxin
VKRDCDASARQVPGRDAAKASGFRDDRCTFTEEQVRKETARCLGCGASFVDPNKCLGCGVCTSRCRFDAIHLRKRSNVESIDYFDRPKVLPEFIAAREKRIEIRKMQQG